MITQQQQQHPLVCSLYRLKQQKFYQRNCYGLKKNVSSPMLLSSPPRRTYWMAALLVLVVVISSVSNVYSKEIVAKHDEWTRIGENDTVDAGMHIRIDMTTGEKWVKQLDRTDDSETKQESKLSTSALQVVSTGVVGEDDGTNSQSKRELQKQTELSINGETTSSRTVELPKRIIYNKDDNDTSPLSSDDAQQQHAKYDYDMMYRTLSKLPVDEQQRMQLPTEYVAGTDDTVPALNGTSHRYKRQQFETTLRYIWEQRQQQLLDLEIADLPKILKEYISDIYNYIDQQIEDGDDARTYSINHQTKNSTNNITHPHIISILQDLEYQLQDIDLTRDFHTLNGWNALVSLLSLNNNNNNNATSFTESNQQQQNELQMHTAWVIGTALKHIPEFHAYAIEPIRLPVASSSHDSTTTTTLDLILQQIQVSFQQYNDNVAVQQHQLNGNLNATLGNKVDSAAMKMLRTKLLRFIYCFGSLLRGNYYAQQYLLDTMTPPQSTKELTNLLQQFMNHILVPSLQQIYHFQVVLSYTNNSINLENTMTTEQLQQNHIDFLYKFMQRSFNVLSDCLNEIRLNIISGDEHKSVNDSKWDLQNTNPTLFQQIQTIYKLWQSTLCSKTDKTTNTSDSTITAAASATSEHRLLKSHQTTNSTRIIDLKSFLSSSTPTSIGEEHDADDPNRMEDLQAVIDSILDHCP